MSSLSSAPTDPPAGPLVTPASPARRDSTSTPASPPRTPTMDDQRSPYSLRRTNTTPAAHYRQQLGASATFRSQSPQLSERDSIFATHYLPSDNDPQSPLRDPFSPQQLVKPNGNSHSPETVRGADDAQQWKVKRFPVRHDVSALSAAVNAANAVDAALDGHPGECVSPMTCIIAAPQGLPANDVMSPPLPAEPASRKRDNTRSSTQESRRSERSASKSRPRVEKSIEASLADADSSLNVRSRKSSHYLGLFKENTAKKRDDDDMVRSPKKSTPKAEGEQPEAPKLILPQRPHLPHTTTSPVTEHPEELVEPEKPVRNGHGHIEKSQNIAIPPRTPKPLPAELLDEIRNYHETVSGKPDRNGSPPLSRSVPTPFRDRNTQLYRFGNAFQTPSPESDADRTHRESPERSDEEDNDKEHISSALYFPHKRTVPEGMEDSSMLEEEAHEEDHIQQHDGPSGEDDGRWAATPEPVTADSVDISLRSMGDNRILHEGLRGSKVALNEVKEPSMIPHPESVYESLSEAESVSEYGSVSGKEDESSHTDDAGTTPTATSHMQKHVQPEPPAPLGAVELKPYRHQVGGHTTVFRFSRRAVCKQLNNRENVFYERIERRHPEMLVFLPR